MHQVSPRFGYYIISLGTVLEFLGLVGKSWSGEGSSAAGAAFSFSQPGDVLLVIGLAITVLGTLLGLLSLAESLSQDVHRPPRLLPALPLVLLAGFAIGSVAFAFQAGESSAGTSQNAAVASQPPGVSALVSAGETVSCPPGSFFNLGSQQCLQVDANGVAVAVTPVPPGATPVCPAGTVWHPAGIHCLSTACPAGSAFDAAFFVCVGVAPATPGLSTGPSPTLICPADTFWHPVMNHCMPTVCPAGFEWSLTALTCVQVAVPTAVPTSTPTPAPGVTPSPTPDVTPTPTAEPAPSCPAGYFWHPAMGHCMSNTCPPGLVLDPVTLYCVLPSTGEPTATPTATLAATPTPVSPACPAGYFWHPAMGHCMSETCPKGLVLDPVTLYCVLPAPTPDVV